MSVTKSGGHKSSCLILDVAPARVFETLLRVKSKLAPEEYLRVSVVSSPLTQRPSVGRGSSPPSGVARGRLSYFERCEPILSAGRGNTALAGERSPRTLL